MPRLSAPLVLASASPRWRALLRQVGLSFTVKTSQVDEGGLSATGASAFATLAARAKAADVATQCPNEAYVLGADTVVCVGRKVLGKPGDTKEAIQRYAQSLEGRDKAGAYAIQGMAAAFVKQIQGSYSNVVGLPLCETPGLMREHGLLVQWP